MNRFVRRVRDEKVLTPARVSATVFVALMSATFVLALGACSGVAPADAPRVTAQSPAAPDNAQRATRRNVLMIIIDDLRPQLGAYGDELARTPNIDALAKGGVIFDAAYATVPVCGASRASMLSSRQPTTNRFLSYSARLDDDLPGAPTLPGFMKSHGYTTHALGKVFDGTQDSVGDWSDGLWNPPAPTPGAGLDTGAWTSSVPRGGRLEDLQKAYLNNPPGEMGPAFERVDAADNDYPDGRVAERAVARLHTLAGDGQPFFMAVGFRKPHLPFTAPERYWRPFDEVEFELRESFNEVPDGVPLMALHNSVELRKQYTGIPAEGPLPAELSRTLIHGYYAAVSYADALVGQILAALSQTGLDRSTVVVLVGDHGWNLGEHTLWAKHALFDVTLRVPLIVRLPAEVAAVTQPRPRRVAGLVDLMDVFPTLADLAGLPPPESAEGVSLVPALTRPNGVTKAATFSRWFNGESVRTARYRYTRWRDEPGAQLAHMLYDLAEDPLERRNVAEDSGMSEVVSHHRGLLDGNATHVAWSPALRTRLGR